MKIKITAGGIYNGVGEEIPVGTELDIADHEGDAPHPWAGRFETISSGKSADAKDEDPAGPFTIAAGAAGWFNILDVKGEKVGKSVREDDAKAFSELSPSDQAEFAAEHAKS